MAEIGNPPGVSVADLAAAVAPKADASAMSAGLAAKADASTVASLGRARVMYTSSNAETIVTGANTIVSMLSASTQTGIASVAVPANAMPVGASLLVTGTGLIGARSVTPPGFNLQPWVTPAGGSKTTLAGFAQAPLLGADGFCQIWLRFTQLAEGVRTSGVVQYGVQGGMPYSITVNPGTTGALPSVTASDPTVARTFGVDGFWGSGADTREYVRSRDIQALLCTMGG